MSSNILVGMLSKRGSKVISFLVQLRADSKSTKASEKNGFSGKYASSTKIDCICGSKGNAATEVTTNQTTEIAMITCNVFGLLFEANG